MSVNNYFNVVVANQSFYIVESSSKFEKRNCAISTLNKIEFVIKNRLKYAPQNVDDLYSRMAEGDLLEVLKQKTVQIHEGYTRKLSKSYWFIRLLFGNERLVSRICARIENVISPPRFFSMPDDLTLLVMQYLEISDLAHCAQTNRHGRSLAQKSILLCAKEFGYVESREGETQYLKNLIKEVGDFNQISTKGLLPISWNNKTGKLWLRKTFWLRRTLRNIKAAVPEKIFKLLGTGHLYTDSFTTFRKIFRKENWKITKVCNDAVTKKADKALILAVERAEKEVADFLVHFGANVNAQNPGGATAFALAVFNDNIEIAQFFLDKGAKVDPISQRGNTPLIYAADHGCIQIAQLLLEAGATATIDHISHTLQRNALHRAALKGLFAMVELLLKYGANVNAQSPDGITALDVAVYSGKANFNNKIATIKLLLSKGANVNTIAQNGTTPLGRAVEIDSIEIARLLLEAGAARTIDHVNHTFGCNALHMAAYNGRIAMVKLLLAYGANVSIQTRDGRTAYTLSRTQGHDDVAQLFLVKARLV